MSNPAAQPDAYLVRHTRYGDPMLKALRKVRETATKIVFQASVSGWEYIYSKRTEKVISPPYGDCTIRFDVEKVEEGIEERRKAREARRRAAQSVADMTGFFNGKKNGFGDYCLSEAMVAIIEDATSKLLKLQEEERQESIRKWGN
ncbi:MAG: hypothetical protein KDD43_16520 [Bdellovibrionales bacterium]|nr:hypothetical protein [Bdellovibrionales bacterium]